MIRLIPKKNSMIVIQDNAIRIKLHKRQVWYGKEVEEDTLEIERDNLRIRFEKSVVQDLFREEI